MNEPADIVSDAAKSASKTNPILVFLVVATVCAVGGSMWFEVRRTEQIVAYIRARDAFDVTMQQSFQDYLEARDERLAPLLRACIDKTRGVQGRAYSKRVTIRTPAPSSVPSYTAQVPRCPRVVSNTTAEPSRQR